MTTTTAAAATTTAKTAVTAFVAPATTTTSAAAAAVHPTMMSPMTSCVLVFDESRPNNTDKTSQPAVVNDPPSCKEISSNGSRTTTMATAVTTTPIVNNVDKATKITVASVTATTATTTTATIATTATLTTRTTGYDSVHNSDSNYKNDSCFDSSTLQKTVLSRLSGCQPDSATTTAAVTATATTTTTKQTKIVNDNDDNGIFIRATTTTSTRTQLQKRATRTKASANKQPRIRRVSSGSSPRADGSGERAAHHHHNHDDDDDCDVNSSKMQPSLQHHKSSVAAVAAAAAALVDIQPRRRSKRNRDDRMSLQTCLDRSSLHYRRLHDLFWNSSLTTATPRRTLLQIRPYRLQAVSTDPPIYVIDDFLSSKDLQYLHQCIAKGRFQRSYVDQIPHCDDDDDHDEHDHGEDHDTPKPTTTKSTSGISADSTTEQGIISAIPSRSAMIPSNSRIAADHPGGACDIESTNELHHRSSGNNNNNSNSNCNPLVVDEVGGDDDDDDDDPHQQQSHDALRDPNTKKKQKATSRLGLLSGSAATSVTMTARSLYDTDHRTSTFLSFGRQQNARIASIEERAAHLLGCYSTSTVEPLQLVRYHVGQFFGIHHDLGDYDAGTGTVTMPPKSIYMKRRLVTVFCYLNHVKQGGATYFPNTIHGDLRIMPVPGRAVVFCNVLSTGQPDPRTIHAGEVVMDGIKYGLNIWICEG